MKNQDHTIPVVEPQYADDAVVRAHLERDFYKIVNVFTGVYETMGLTRRINENKVPHQKYSPCIRATISLHRKRIEVVYKFRCVKSPRKNANVPEKIQH